VATAKKSAQIVLANMIRASVLQLGGAFATPVYSPPVDARRPFVSSPHLSPLVALMFQPWADLEPFYWFQIHQCFALSLAVKSTIHRVVSLKSL
jgi:hypothetical protein